MNNDSSPSKAVEIAIQHVEAFSNHDYDTARSLLAALTSAWSQRIALAPTIG
jgi:hypothetical protein